MNYNLTEQCTAVVKHQMENGEKPIPSQKYN